MKMKIEISDINYCSGINSQQRNWNCNIYVDNIIFCKIYGESEKEVKTNSNLIKNLLLKDNLNRLIK